MRYIKLAGAAAALASLALLGATVPAGAAVQAHPAATQSCGGNCSDAYSDQWSAAFTMNVFGQTVTPGSKVGLRVAGNYAHEDFQFNILGTVRDLYRHGIITNHELVQLYGDDPAFEVDYAPDGDNGADLCAGLARTAYTGEYVRAETCGQTALTVWIANFADATSPGRYDSNTYVPVISGADEGFSRLESLTSGPYVPSTGGRGQYLRMTPLGKDNFVVNPDQLWSTENGPAFP